MKTKLVIISVFLFAAAVTLALGAAIADAARDYRIIPYQKTVEAGTLQDLDNKVNTVLLRPDECYPLGPPITSLTAMAYVQTVICWRLMTPER